MSDGTGIAINATGGTQAVLVFITELTNDVSVADNEFAGVDGAGSFSVVSGSSFSGAVSGNACVTDASLDDGLLS